VLVQSGANVLILDEPTNHLDLESREALESALQKFHGALLLISHDRALLDAVGTRTIAIEDRTLHSYVGGWPEYVRVREERAEMEREAKARGKAAAKVNGKGAKPAAAPGAPAPGSKNQARVARRLEAEIEKAEAELAAIEEALADPQAWNDPRTAQKSTRRHKEAKARIDALYAELETVAG
jgi:ATP-binding cassette subfamily F protein 3